MFGAFTNKFSLVHGLLPRRYLWVWGGNSHGQLGLGHKRIISYPVLFNAERDWKFIKTAYRGIFGDGHTLAIKRNGTLWAWGLRTWGQLGDNISSSIGISSPIQVGSGITGNWSVVACASTLSSGIKFDGSLWSWGRNFEGQLGLNDTTNRSSPVQVGSDSDWAYSVVGGESEVTTFTLAQKLNGTLWSWGRNIWGNLGINSTIDQSSPVQVGSGITGDWVSVKTNSRHVLALKTNQTLWAWGINSSGQLGLGNTTARSSPVQIGTDSWRTISCGGAHSLAIKTNGTLWAWGQNFYGQLGQGNDTNRSSPVQVGTDTDWKYILAGYQHSVAIKTNGTTWSWGRNIYGNLGRGLSYNNYNPVRIGSLTGWSSSFVCGTNHNVVIRDDGTMFSWGQNNFAQLGIGTQTSRVSSPVQIGSGSTGDWTKVAAGRYHSLAIKADSSVWGWGSNDLGALGVTNPSGGGFVNTSPRQIGSLTGWSSISCGRDHSLSIRNDGSLWAWGRNHYGQLGQGVTSTAISSPVQIGSLTGWSQIASGIGFLSTEGHHSLAIRENGTLWAWGRNNQSQLGDATTTNRSSPVQIGSGTTGDWLAISCGDLMSAGIRARGPTGRNIWTWGQGLDGKLGDNSTSNNIVPTIVGSFEDRDWDMVSCGGKHMVAIKARGTERTLWGWGYNRFGQLGLGDITNRLSPVQVGTDTDWATVKGGLYHTIATKTDGSIWAFGRSRYGVQGTNNILYAASSPVQIDSSLDWGKPAGTGWLPAGKFSASISNLLIR